MMPNGHCMSVQQQAKGNKTTVAAFLIGHYNELMVLLAFVGDGSAVES